MLSASEPCGEAVNEDDVESGSPFLYALNNQSLTRPDRAIRCISDVYGHKKTRAIAISPILC